MPVDPQLAELLRRVDEAPPMSSHTPGEARVLFRRLNLLAASATQQIEVGAVEDIEVPGGAGPRPARVYRPKGDGPHPTVAFFHGGGFTIGDLDSYDMQCRLLCAGVDAVLVSTDYRLAPEDPYPAAVEDALAATAWIASELPGPLAVAGDSAGGNLAAIVAQQFRGGGPEIAAQLLIYPATDLASDRPSHEENGRGYFLTLDDMEWFHDNYLPSREAGEDPLASPLYADDLSGLPPTVIATAEFDPLRDDGDAYAEALEKAGVKVIHRRYDGLVHGFFAFGPFSQSADAAVKELCQDLRGLLR
ncbi:MAG: acetyl esterase [Thermoleophilaceae bacterium]|nr:acetyl esterase [Thermoleophilaceae bacterium]